jgi:hypothetical protein
MQSLKSLTYTSRAQLDLSADDILEIRATAIRLNALDGISGILIFDGTRFLQVIEGSEGAIDNLVQRLQRDDRHLAFEIRDERTVAERSFPDWSMELIRVSAGFMNAREELGAALPAQVTPEVRSLIMGMSERLAQAIDMT